MNSQPQVEYEVSRDGKVIGSFTAEQLSSCVKQGHLLVTDQYWREGWPEPQALADLFPANTRAIKRDERMELRHIGIATVMLLGITAVGVGVFAITRANRHIPPIEATALTLPSPEPKAIAIAPMTPSAPAIHGVQANTISAGIGQPAPPDKKSGADFEKQSEELYQKARRLSKGEEVLKDANAAVKIWQQLAQQGHAKARFNLGVSYYDGEGVSKDVTKAVEWWTKAADQGDSDAQYILGLLYYYGEEVPRDAAKAEEWFTKAAANGDATVQFRIGGMYAAGVGATKDGDKAAEWYRKAAAQGHVDAQFKLGLSYYQGEGVSKDATKALEWWAKAADQGDATSQFNVGLIYAKGEGIPKDPAKAARWYTKAAEQEYAEAQFNLGVMYSNGEGVPKNDAKAVEWYMRAAESGHAGAQLNLGNSYSDGNGVPKDVAKAVEWYTKAAEQNDIGAQINLAVMYRFGKGIPKDAVKAAEWTTKAAQQGHADAQFILGGNYEVGEGVEKDSVEAARWYTKAAEQGHRYAQLALALKCYSGKGVAKDLVQSHYWFNLAGAAGDEQARVNLASLESIMAPSQIAEAERLAREFKPRKAIAETTNVSPTMITDSRPAGHGTGFFISPDGYLVTNHHVVEGTSQVRINTGSGIKAARIIRLDKANDLALLKVDGTFPALPIASSRAIALGNTVATVGFPNIELMGFSPKLAKGDIASLAGIQDDPRYFQISVPVQPGNSGGALVDGAGNVVGVVSAKLSARAALATTGSLPENVNYAVKSSFLLSFLESVPELAGKLPDPHSGERKFEDVVKDAQQASVLVLVY